MHKQINLRTIIAFDDRCSQKRQEFHQQIFLLCEKVVFLFHFAQFWSENRQSESEFNN